MIGADGAAESVDAALDRSENLMIWASSSRTIGADVTEIIASNARACIETAGLLLIVNLPG